MTQTVEPTYKHEDLNALKFKAQMVDLYIQSLFPKKFFSTNISNYYVDLWRSKWVIE
jgi:hypothetical protein